ncbi:hypothetical protein EC991_010588 [Linnemannia zychae]|nr:hypothetical protein EC991_010588 [Linnemannia zychae]
MPGSLEKSLRRNNSSSQRVLQTLQNAQASSSNKHPNPHHRNRNHDYYQPSQQTIHAIKSHLRSCITENSLESLYSINDPSFNSRFHRALHRVLQTNFHKNIALDWKGVNVQLAQVLCKLALYDIILLIDDSSSIQKANHIDGRLEDLEFLVSTIAEVAALFDDDGIDIEFLNSERFHRGVKEGQAVRRILNEVEFLGKTRIGEALHDKIHRRFFHEAAANGTKLEMQKPVLVFIITDGEPYGEPMDALEFQIRKASRFLQQNGYPTDFISYQIAQVGNDPKASAFLNSLDENRDLGDFIDVTARFEIEAGQLERLGYDPTPEVYLIKLLLGAIDQRFDRMNEQQRRPLGPHTRQ